MNGSRVRNPSFSIAARNDSASSSWRGSKGVFRSLRYSARRFRAISKGFIPTPVDPQSNPRTNPVSNLGHFRNGLGYEHAFTSLRPNKQLPNWAEPRAVGLKVIV